MARHGENIRKRKGDRRWEARYKVFDAEKGREVYRSVYGSTYEEAKERRAAAVRGAEGAQGPGAGETPGGKPCQAVLFSQAAAEWLAETEANRKPSTYVKYENVYRTHLAGTLGPCLLSGMGGTKLQEKISDHLSGAGLSDSLKGSVCCVANQILAFASRKYSVRVPTLKKPAMKRAKKPIETFSREEQSSLLSYLYAHLGLAADALLLCLYTGLRLGELCALKWADIDFQGRTVTVGRTVQRIAVKGLPTRTALIETDPKSESSGRAIPLPGEILEILAQAKGDQAYVFGGDKPLDPRTMQYRFKRILKEAGVRDRNFHILRHTFATNCVESGMDVKALSEILGHSDVKITLNRYVHPTMDSKRRQVGLLLDFYGQIRGQAA